MFHRRIQHGFWNTNGRICRRGYALYYFAPFALLTLVLFLWYRVFIASAELREKHFPDDADVFIVLSIVSFVLIIVPFLTSMVAMIIGQVKRLHDLGYIGTWVLLNFAPVINILFWIYLLSAKGFRDTNEYGHNPAHRSRKHHRRHRSRRVRDSEI